jgi:4-oxalocrotonate tautomerase
MPIVTIDLVEGRTVEQKRALAKRITDAIVELLKTTPEQVTIIFHDGPRSNFAKAGALLSDRK